MSRRKSQFAFGSRPLIYHSRSQFDLSYHHKTTLNAGDLVPFYIQEIIPGDTFNCKANFVARVTSSMLKPVMDNAFVDMFFFYVPSRLVMNDFSAVFGENKVSAWAPAVDTTIPTVGFPASGQASATSHVAVNSLADYLGIPKGFSSAQLSAMGDCSSLPFRVYALVYDEWFRDENNIDPMLINKGSFGQGSKENVNNQPFSPSNYTGMPAKIGKMHDMFTSCLPAPQRGNPVSVGSAQVPERVLPVSTLPYNTLSGQVNVSGSLMPDASDLVPLARSAGYTLPGVLASGSRSMFFSASPTDWNPPSGNQNGVRIITSASTNNGSLTGTTHATAPTGSNTLYPANLVAYDPGVQLGAVSVNDLRFAFQLQKMLEKDARGGTRYTEYLREHYGVISPDARLNRSEYLGGKRVPLSVFQVAQTSQASEDSPLANVGAFSLSSGRAGYTKGFVEHGYVIGVCAVRQFHTYQQGLSKMWSRTKRTDFYDPVFANIGEQPIMTKELYAGSDSDTVFGYNEAWVQYRYNQSRVSGELSSTADEGLDIWHFADEYDNAPVLGQEFIEETSEFIDRTLSVPSSTVSQFIFDFYFDQKATRVLPTYSIPGLIDHH